MRVRPVAAGVVEVDVEERLLVTPSTYLGEDDELRPLLLFTEEDTLLLLLPLKDDERPEVADNERPLLDETR
jgi:hypothetical protein